MDGSRTERISGADEESADSLESQGDRASEGLRDQIAALRRQVKDAQESLRASREGSTLKA
jgi:hypothetical protein